MQPGVNRFRRYFRWRVDLSMGWKPGSKDSSPESMEARPWFYLVRQAREWAEYEANYSVRRRARAIYHWARWTN